MTRVRGILDDMSCLSKAVLMMNVSDDSQLGAGDVLAGFHKLLEGQFLRMFSMVQQ